MSDNTGELKTTPPATSKKVTSNVGKIVAVVVGIVVVLAVGLGVGLGVGLKKTHSHTSVSKDTGVTAPGNVSAITTVTSRDDLLGDQSRWLGSTRNFTVSDTPTTRYFKWTISEVLSSPGAMMRPTIVVNGLSPGPVVEANLGDRLIIEVHNNLANETAIHWHGMYMRDTNYMDGTYSITQCGIPPGGSMTYNWTVQNVGTSWYHAHKAAQYTDGLFGALVLNAPNETAMTAHSYDDEYTFLLNDMYNTVSSALEWRFTSTGTGIDGQPGDEPTGDGGMINGVSQARCAYIPSSDMVIPERKRGLAARWNEVGRTAKRSFRERSATGGTYYPETNDCGNLTTDYWNVTLVGSHTYRLRLINAGTFVNTIFSIDNHTLTVIEADGVSIEPYTATSINLAVAQRYSVLVTLDQPAGAYWIRNTLATDQIRYNGPDFNETTLGVLRYEGVASTVVPADLPASVIGNATELDPHTTLVPADKLDAPLPTVAQYVQFNMQYTEDNNHYMFFNGSSWSPLSPGESAFDLVVAGASNLSAANIGNQLSFVNDNAGVMDLVVNSLDDGDHPFHLHGHTFWIMSAGDGHFYDSTAGLNTTNPMRRDTILIPSYGHVVLRFRTDNPGIWAFHCHIAWHMEIGLLLTVTNLPKEMAALEMPKEMADMCARDKQLGY